MISRTVDRVISRRMLPEVAAVFFLVLAIAPEAKWRLRDPGASAAATADLQTLVELGLYAGIGAWAAWHLLRGWSSRRYRLQAAGPAMIVLLAITVLLLSTGTLALSSRSLTRSVQYAIMALTVLLVAWEARADTAFFEAFWRVVRRGFVAFALFATAVTAVVPAFDGSIDDAGIRRYGWMEIHPITTAGMIGVVLLAIFGGHLGLPDRLMLRKGMRIASFGLAAAFVGLLLLTNSRGATIATALALVVLVVITPRQRLRRFGLLALLMIMGLAIGYFASEGGSSQLEAFVNRGQTTEQVLSLSQRTVLFEIGMDYFAERPLFGHGYMIPGTLLRTHFVWAGHAHNVLLEILMGLGIVGVAAFLTLIVLILGGLLAGLRTPYGRTTGIPAEGMALATLILVQGVISDGFAGPVGWEVGVLMLTVLISDLGRVWRRHPAVTTEKPETVSERGAGADSSAAAAASVTHDGQVDINVASVQELMRLPGVGRRIASRIYVYRASNGLFASVDGLLAVRGIGPRVLARLRPHATVASQTRHEFRLRRW